MKCKKLLAALSAAAIFTQIPVFAYDTTPSTEYRIFEQIAGYASMYYIDDSLTSEDIMKIGISKALEENPELLEELLKSTFSGLDPYCEYFTPEEYASFQNQLDSLRYGIGATLQKIDSYVTIMGFTEQSYAPASGLEVGDKIIKVEGQDVVGASLNSVSSMLLSDQTLPVNVTVLRGTQELTFSIPRSEIVEKTVSYTFPYEDVSYIRISNMSINTATEFTEALGAVDAHNITKIILDLRGNPGGYVDAAVKIASQIIPAGKIVDTIYRNEEFNTSYYSDLENPKYYFNVLVNGSTASATELLAAAIRDSGVGTLIGENTYGKALMQITIPLTNGSAFKITTGHYLTRNGEDINEVGIEPDEIIANSTKLINTSDYGQMDYRTKWELGMYGDSITAAKARLTILGYYSGGINSTFDEALADAVARFQEDQELYPYGVLDITTQVRLENVFSQIEVTVDNQLGKAYELFGHDPDIESEEDAQQ